MKTLKLIIPVAAVLLLAGQAVAQGEEDASAQAEQEAMEAREAEVQQKLAEAERKMAEAARQIAELTSERLPKLREIERRIEIFSDGRPRLGVNIGEGQEHGGPVEGVHIVGVSPGSAADEAGLRAGDMITAINGDSMSADDSHAANMKILDFMKGVEEGDVLDLEYLRNGKVGTVEIEPRAVEMSAFEFKGMPREFHVPDLHIPPGVIDKFREYRYAWGGSAWGDMELVELNEGLGKYFGTDSGVLVVSAPESDALQLEDGDVIQKIDGREPKSVRHALRILSSYQPGESLELEIMRDKRSRTLAVEMPDDRQSFLAPPAAPAKPAVAPVAPRRHLPAEKT